MLINVGRSNSSTVQCVTRKDTGRKFYILYIPQDAVDLAGLKKGDKCEVNAVGAGKLEVIRL